MTIASVTNVLDEHRFSPGGVSSVTIDCSYLPNGFTHFSVLGRLKDVEIEASVDISLSCILGFD